MSRSFFFFNDTATTEIYTLSLHDALPIHPAQIGPANAAFSPTAEEAAQARRIIAAYAEAAGAGKGAVRIDGRLVEALHVEAAYRTVALRSEEHTSELQSQSN